MPLYIGEPGNVTVTGLRNNTTGAYVNDATITFALKEQDGDTVPNGTGTCSYVALSNGNYLGVLSPNATILLTPGTEYKMYVTGTLPGGAVILYRVDPYRAQFRGQN